MIAKLDVEASRQRTAARGANETGQSECGSAKATEWPAAFAQCLNTMFNPGLTSAGST